MAGPSTFQGGLKLLSSSQSVLSVWATLPKRIERKDMSRERVAASLKGMPDASQMGPVVAEFEPLPHGSEFLAWRFELAGRDESGRSTPKTMARWRTDLAGLVFDLWVDTVASIKTTPRGPVQLDANTVRATSLVFNPTGLALYKDNDIYNKSVIYSWFAKLVTKISWRLRSWASRGELHEENKGRLTDFVKNLIRKYTQGLVEAKSGNNFSDPGRIAIPLNLKAGERVIVRCRFPDGWKASRAWQIGFMLVGIRQDLLK